MLKELLGLIPTKVSDNIYSPSPGWLKVRVWDESGYKGKEYGSQYEGNKKILVVCTEESHMEMKNGDIFLTGNHPVETFVPLMHLASAGYKFDFATPTGRPVAIEEWAFPREDPEFDSFFKAQKSAIDSPLKLADAAKGVKEDAYVAVFIPGGHGALLGLPQDKNLGEILHDAMNKGLKIISLCHGPAALLAASEGSTKGDFLFNGFAIAAFPDGMDKQLPKFGYLPGKMPWYFGKRLTSLGVDIINHLATGKTHVDRNLITGDSPMSANTLGEIATEALLSDSTST